MQKAKRKETLIMANNQYTIRNPQYAIGSTNSYVRKNQPFLTNKANFRKDKMNLNSYSTKDYENKTLSRSGKNKANSKPIKANFKKAKMNVNKVLTMDYENNSNCKLCENKPNSKPIQTQNEPNFKGKTSDEQVITRKDEQAISRYDEQMTRRKDEHITRPKNEQVTRRKEKGEVRR